MERDWFMGNIVASCAAGPGSIPDQVNFLVEVYLVDQVAQAARYLTMGWTARVRS